jgi:hypothetical protein
MHLAIRHNLRIHRYSKTALLHRTNTNIVSAGILLPIGAKQHLHKHSKFRPIKHIREIRTRQSPPALVTKEVQIGTL